MPSRIPPPWINRRRNANVAHRAALKRTAKFPTDKASARALCADAAATHPITRVPPVDRKS